MLDGKKKGLQEKNLNVKQGVLAVTLPPYSVSAVEFIQRDSSSPPVNLALSAEATASSYSTTGPHFKPPSAIDGILDTRWNSAAWTKSNGQEEQWFQLVWKKPQQIKRITIAWGESYAVRYVLRASLDGKKWMTIESVDNGTGENEEHTVSPVEARYLRFEGKQGTKGISAYSIREMGVFGE